MKAIGATPQLALSAVRLSLGYDTTSSDIDTAAERIVSAHREAMAATRRVSA